ncbi:hypothetical protein MHBO_001929 [Bonamia ostreae]|uniref:Uncharacterized protein n=1 Tax=Bonamia ostreae TaxID=126728 RepID=A0ABV2AKM8_9EUKA
MVSDLKAYGTEILSDRLTPPPTEAYTLHRKLSGCYLTCFKLKAIVRCKQIFETRLKNYDWKNVIKDSVIN